EQRLRWYAAIPQAVATQLMLLDQRDPGAERGTAGRDHQAGRAGTDDDEIEFGSGQRRARAVRGFPDCTRGAESFCVDARIGRCDALRLSHSCAGALCRLGRAPLLRLQTVIDPRRSQLFLHAVLPQPRLEAGEVDQIERLVLVETGEDVGCLAGDWI